MSEKGDWSNLPERPEGCLAPIGPVPFFAVKLPPAESELARLVELMCDGAISPAERDRLESLLTSDREAQLYYVAYLDLHAEIQWMMRDEGAGEKAEGGRWTAETTYLPSPFGRGAVEKLPSPFGRGAGGEGGEVDVGSQEPVPSAPYSVLRTTYSPFSSFLPTTPLGNVTFSYAMSAVLVCLGLWIFSLMSTSSSSNAIVGNDPTDANSRNLMTPDVPAPESEPKIVSIAQITGMVDCVWVNANESPFHNKIKLHDKFALKSGLMEITYHTGAKVILQGPCTYEVESADSGYLSLGKLTARVEKKAEGGRRKAESISPRPFDGRGAGGESGVESPDQSALTLALSQRARGPNTSPFPLPPSPLFAVRTPTATVTDLGTEFCVEVGEQGESNVAVFEGKVVFACQHSGAKPVLLKAGQSARLDRTKFIVRETTEKMPAFPRKLSRPMPLPILCYAMEDASGPLQSSCGNHAARENGGGGFLYRQRGAPAGVYGAITLGSGGTGYAVGLSNAESQWDLDPAETARVNLVNDFTTMAWVFFSAPPGNGRDIATIIGPAANLEDFGWSLSILHNNDSAFCGIILTGKSVLDCFSKTGIDWGCGRWHHIAASKSSTQGIWFYLDGRLVTSDPAATGDFQYLNAGKRYAIGRSNNHAYESMIGGAIDEVRVYDKVLTQEEIVAAAGDVTALKVQKAGPPPGKRRIAAQDAKPLSERGVSGGSR